MARGIALATVVSVLAVIAACTPTSSTGPHPDVTGSWTLQGAFFADSDTLEITGLVMTLRQSGAAFTGTYSGAVISVHNRPNYNPPSAGPSSGSISSGIATGATVVFSPSLTSVPFKGVMTDSAMQGGGTINYTGSQGSEKFTGGWTANRN